MAEQLDDVEAEMREYAQLVRDGIPFSLGVPTFERWADAVQQWEQRCRELEQALREVVTNGVWQGETDWLISDAVYEMAWAALTAAAPSQEQP